MNTRALTLALIIAGIAMYMVYTYVEGQEAQQIKKFGVEKSVVVAKVDIEELELIDDSKVTVRSVPQSFIQPGAFMEIKELTNTIATVPILKDEQLTKTKVTYPGAKTGLSRQVSLGKRAFALAVTPQSAVGKLIKPGDRVDVIAAIDYGSGRKDLDKVQTVLQDVFVLSTGRSVTNALPIFGVKTPDEIKKVNATVYENYDTVTLEVEPYEAQKLVYILQRMNAFPFLSLRNNSDKKRENVPPTDIFDILGDDKVEARKYFDERYKKAR